MNQLQSSPNIRQSSLVSTRTFGKYKSPSKTPSQKNKTITNISYKIDSKEEKKIQYQLSVKGKTMNRQTYEQRGKQKKVKSSNNRQYSKQHHFWLGSATVSSPVQLSIKQKQNLLSTLQVSKHTQILTFYHSNVFACHNQHNRFNKILRKKYCNPSFKTQYCRQQSQEPFQQTHRNFQLKNTLNETSKIEVRRSSLLITNQKKGSQLFEPRLRYKKRPKSVDNSKKYKMNSLFVKLRKNSIAEVDKNINVEHAHIEPLKYQEQNQAQMTQDDKKILNVRQSISIEYTRRNGNLMIKTQSSPSRNKSRIRQKETILTSGRGINPWSDEQWKAKNIFDEQINVKLLS